MLAVVAVPATVITPVRQRLARRGECDDGGGQGGDHRYFPKPGHRTLSRYDLTSALVAWNHAPPSLYGR
jgi:hypothetical protein